MEKIWLKSYPAGVPAEIDVNTYASLREVLEESCAQVRIAARAIRAWASTITFAELDELSAAFGAFLQATRPGQGARVALMMPNVLQYPVCLFGILRAGCTVVNVNPLYTPRELEHQLDRQRRRDDRRRRELRAHARGSASARRRSSTSS